MDRTPTPDANVTAFGRSDVLVIVATVATVVAAILIPPARHFLGDTFGTVFTGLGAVVDFLGSLASKVGQSVIAIAPFVGPGGVA